MKRLENGLIEGVNYIYDDTGKINWLKMIPEDCLYINKDKKNKIEKRLGKKFSDIKISEALDTELVITLQGIRYLLDLRGYTTCDIKLDIATEDYAAATCSIRFIKNEEDFEQVFTGCASAHPRNTKSWYRNYLVEAASNRALCRAVRFFLKLNIVSNDELGTEMEEEISETKQTQIPDIYNELNTLMSSQNITLETLNKEFGKGKEWDKLSSIPRATVFLILGKLKQN